MKQIAKIKIVSLDKGTEHAEEEVASIIQNEVGGRLINIFVGDSFIVVYYSEEA